MPIRGALLLAYFIGSLPICFFRPFYGILLWTVIAFLNPQSAFFYWSPALLFPWAVAIAVPTLAGSVALHRGWGRVRSREFYFLIVLWGWFTITSLLSSSSITFSHHSADTWYQWRNVSKILLMTVVMMVLINSLDRLRTLLLVIAGCFGVFVAKSFVFILLTGGAFKVYGPENSMIADNNDFGLALNMTLPLFFTLAQTEGRTWVRYLFGFCFVVSIPAVFCTYSRGALVGLIAVMTLLLLRSKKRAFLILACAFAVLLVVEYAPETWKHRMDLTSPDVVDGSARSRLNAWQYSWNLARDYPIAGGGFATFTPSLFAQYAPNSTDIHGPHSIYFGVLAEHGFVGLLLYLALVLSCFLSSHKVAKQAHACGDDIVVNYANMLRIGMVGFLTSGIFLGRAYFDYFFTIVACIVVLKKVAQEQWDSEEGEQEGDAALPAWPPEGEVLWER